VLSSNIENNVLGDDEDDDETKIFSLFAKSCGLTNPIRDLFIGG
jgi:hypothetical protein